MPVKKTPLVQKESETGDTTKQARRETLPNVIVTHTFPGISPPAIKGTEQPVPGRAPLCSPRLPSSAVVPLRPWAGSGGEGRCSTGDTKTALIFKAPDEILITTTKWH